MPEVMLLVKFSGLTWATPKESELELMRLKMVPWLCSCFRTILCFPCFLTIFYPCLSESMTSCTAAAWLAVLCIQISWMKRKQQNLCMRALSQKYYILLKIFFLYFYYIFCCGLGLSSINMTFFSFIRNYKSLKDFLFFSGWEV